jgi:hypothetical protein
MPYKPTETDIRWADSLVHILNEQAVWAWPDTGLVYKLNKASRELVLQNQELLDDPTRLAAHKRTVEVFSQIGFDVLPHDLYNPI